MNKIPWSLVRLYFFGFSFYQKFHHFFIPLFRKKNDTKVFCIGYVKTGTTSLYKAFNILDYRAGHLLKRGSEPKEGWIEYIKKSNYDAFTDWPSARIYKDLDKVIPGSKFILTARDKKALIRSVENYFKGSPWELKNSQASEQWLQKYEKHTQEVAKYFKDRPDQLLVMNVIKGDGWEKLCSFLNKPIPDVPFPHKNVGRYKKEVK